MTFVLLLLFLSRRRPVYFRNLVLSPLTETQLSFGCTTTVVCCLAIAVMRNPVSDPRSQRPVYRCPARSTVPISLRLSSSRVVRAFLIEEQKIVKQVLLEKQKKKKA